MKIAYFDCFSGASGDMIAGALLDAGLKLATLKRELAKLKVRGFELKTRRVKRGMFRALKFDVQAGGEHHPHRTLRDIESIIDRSALSNRVKDDSKRVFERLARAEAKVHGTTPEKIHFHEVGAVDSIVDIVSAAIGLEQLGIERVHFSPVRLGTGMVRCRHGILPVPAPATVELLKGVPVSQTDISGELTTPTGAAILTTLGACAPASPTRFTAIGLGAGSKDRPDLPNIIRVMIGETCAKAEGDRVVVLETNIDDMPAEVVGFVFDRLFDAGALDVFMTPIQMKKNRPGVLLSVIVPGLLVETMEEIIFSETTTFGVRKYEIERRKLAREHRSVETPYGRIRVKIGRIGDVVKTVSPEYEDCRKAAERTGAALKDIRQAAMDVARDAVDE
ncbi:MAG: nickel pincer cofactor biosynthesis protein LarC [Planctomycetes bacterium]|nr:nickel pincer cofactor biosynthesis protein LarC [Planctomycetota bacterium]